MINDIIDEIKSRITIFDMTVSEGLKLKKVVADVIRLNVAFTTRQSQV